MTKTHRKSTDAPLADQPDRERIVTALGENLLVEAAAGSGKTQSLAERMTAGIGSGVYDVRHMAAITFTRKAAAELRGRFQQALEARLKQEGAAARRERLERALSDIEQLFAGTIHSFCAHLLAERPVEAHLAPGFTEMDETDDADARREAWRAFVARERASGSPLLAELEDAGVGPADLEEAFAIVCNFDEVDFPAGLTTRPDVVAAWAAVGRFRASLEALCDHRFDEDTTCDVQQKLTETRWRQHVARPDHLGDLLSAIRLWENVAKVTLYQWHPDQEVARGIRDQVLITIGSFQADTVRPFLAQARQHVYRLAMTLLVDGRAFAREERYRCLQLNYNDLLWGARQLLRDDALVRRTLQRKYRWLFVDEFQDTDPIQAEIVLMLAADEPSIDAAALGPNPIDPWSLPLRPGALFVVGDPKQSIFRFRRADIQSYNRIRDLLVRNQQPVRLTTSFRSLSSLIDWTNGAFASVFPSVATDRQPEFQPLAPRPGAMRTTAGADGVRVLTVPPRLEQQAEIVDYEAKAIARYVRGAIDRGERTAGDFMIITRKKAGLATYAAALEALQVPIEVSGGGAFADSPSVAALAALLHVLADPEDKVSLVGVLRGPLFGIADAELFEHRQAGGWFSYLSESRPGPGAPSRVADALATLAELHDVTRRLPAPAAVERVLETTGLLALAAAQSAGGGDAGNVLQAVDLVRQFAGRGWTLGDIADELERLLEEGEVESPPLELGRTDVVRLMNLHKAKGLEAAVVFLANPCGGVKREEEVSVRVDRGGDRPRGYMRILKPNDYRGSGTTIGQPEGWAEHEQAERPFLQAEVARLRYVAATRAKELLVVGRWPGANGRFARPWAPFDGDLANAAELEIPQTANAPAVSAPDLSPERRKQVTRAREDHAHQSQLPSFAVQSPTGPRRDEREEREDESADAAPVVTGAAAGVEWGTLIHRLLEFGTRHRSATDADLERLANWLAVDNPDLHSVVADAVSTTRRVLTSDAWKQARAAGECEVEVPFAVLTPQAGLQPPTIQTGVIDLVYRTDDGWRIVDHKTDQLAERDVEATLARHREQLTAYVHAWKEIVGSERVKAGLNLIRVGKIEWVRP